MSTRLHSALAGLSMTGSNLAQMGPNSKGGDALARARRGFSSSHCSQSLTGVLDSRVMDSQVASKVTTIYFAFINAYLRVFAAGRGVPVRGLQGPCLPLTVTGDLAILARVGNASKRDVLQVSVRDVHVVQHLTNCIPSLRRACAAGHSLNFRQYPWLRYNGARQEAASLGNLGPRVNTR